MMDETMTKPDWLVGTESSAMISFNDRIVAMDSLKGEYVSLPSACFPKKLNAINLILVLAGAVRFRVNFRDMVACDNSWVCFSPGTIIERLDVDSQSRIIYLSFLPGQDMPIAAMPQCMPVCMQPRQLAWLKTSYGMLREILSDDAFNATMREQAAWQCVDLMITIMSSVDKSAQGRTDAKKSRQDEIVAQFLQCVREHYHEKRELGFYADKLGLSLKYMSRVVFELTGRHPSRWIKDYVILDAQAMLRSGHYSVQQVADALHFPNQSFFGKYFKEAVGVSPKKWH